MVGIPKVESCCFCFDLDRGTLFVGVTVVIIAGISLLIVAFFLKKLVVEELNVTDLTKPINGELIEFAALGITSLLTFLTSFVLIVGALKKDELCVKVWLITIIVSLVMYTTFLLYELNKLASGTGGIFFLVLVLTIALGAYYYVVVYNYYTLNFLEKEAQAQEVASFDDDKENTPPRGDAYSIRGYMGAKYFQRNIYKV